MSVQTLRTTRPHQFGQFFAGLTVTLLLIAIACALPLHPHGES